MLNDWSVFISNLPIIFLWIGNMGILLLLCFVVWTCILLCGKIFQWFDNLLYLKKKSWFHEKQLLRTYNSSVDPLVVSWAMSWAQGIGWCFSGIKSELLHPEQIGSTLMIKLKIILSFGRGIAIGIIAGTFPKDQALLSQTQWVCFHAA